MEFIVGILFLLFIDVVLSVDNAILIASTTKDLEGSTKKWAQILGAAGAVLLRLIFVAILMLAFDFLTDVPIVYMLGGAVLIYIGWTISNDNEDEEKKSAGTLWKAVALIMAGDIMMSFDNAIIISEVAMNISDKEWVRVLLVAIALLVSLVIIIFFSSQLANFMKKNVWLIYVAAWLLLGVGIELIIKDPIFNLHTNHYLNMFIAYSLSAAIILCKYYFLDTKHKDDKEVELDEEKEQE